MTESNHVCPECGARVRVRLGENEACPDCKSGSAWTRYGRGKLVVSRDTIAEAEQRRAGEAAGESLWAKVRHVLPTATAVLAGGTAVFFIVRVLQPAALAPLAEVLRHYTALAASATLLGVVALLVGGISFFMVRRSRLYRSWPLLVLNLLAVVAGSAGLLIGGLHWVAASHGLRDIYGERWQHTAMPPVGSIGSPSTLARATMDATVVILASNAEGDMRGMAIGSGVVISRNDRRAWILTNSHVAMPYAGTASFRDPADALPVLVYFPDQRRAEGRVVWVSGPPLDAVVVSVFLDNPPQSIPVATDSELLTAGSQVYFVPNPFRRGWQAHFGTVLRRHTHDWRPTGFFTLIYTDLPVEPGDSGSGLFDERGRLIGINTWAKFDEDDSMPGSGRILPKGISLPAETLQQVMALIQSDSLGTLDTPR